MSEHIEKSNAESACADENRFFDEIEAMIDKSPLHALSLLRSFHRSSMKGHHSRIKTTIVHAYNCALKLQKNKKLIKKFYGEDFFRKRKYALKEAKLLRMTMCYIVGSLDGSDYGQALSYERAVRPFFKRGADPTELLEAFATKSIDDLEKEAKAGKVRTSRKKDDQSYAGSNEEREDEIEDTADAEINKKKSDDASDRSDGSDHSTKKAVTKEVSDTKRVLSLNSLRLASTEEFSMLVLENPKYRRGLIEYTREETDQEFKRITVTAVYSK